MVVRIQNKSLKVITLGRVRLLPMANDIKPEDVKYLAGDKNLKEALKKNPLLEVIGDDSAIFGSEPPKTRGRKKKSDKDQEQAPETNDSEG